MLSDTVSMPADRVTLEGDLSVPESAEAVVLIPHDVDTSRRDPHSQAIATRLRAAGWGTLLVDLLSEREDRGGTERGEQVFDTGLLARRLVAAVDWVGAQPDTRTLPIVLFGCGTQAASVLEAAAELPDRVLTVVLWGGLPDPTADTVRRLRVPVLFVAGGREPGVLRLTEKAARRLHAPHEVRVVPEATHLFQGTDVLDQVTAIADEWCAERLRAARTAARPGR
ncbi:MULTISPECIES: dienelactone hydrolase family protein [unclassified Streptomyces]|uniref:dienelactone hydrolase family protein n=2 Tax=unclassified Streptomyces TaxID=2593676 RepID=UPI00039D5077|nr:MULTISPECIES: dienelactone hydrolase family protein [unclassified Streptomyces]MYX29335.1 hydrolase [Streptomyces sp. SID8381]NED34393.1 hydrolase [Streptomyces sp. SID8499]NMO33152.1 hydrolase [Streptomyces sp. GMY02]